MNWLDLVLMCTVVLMIAVSSKRGLARAGFDTFTVLVARSLSPGMGHAFAHGMKLSANPYANESYCFVVAFVLITAALVAASIKFFGASEYFDSGISALCGVVTGLIVCSVIVKSLAVSAGPKALPDSITLSVFGEQFVTFSWYRHTVEFLAHFSGS